MADRLNAEPIIQNGPAGADAGLSNEQPPENPAWDDETDDDNGEHPDPRLTNPQRRPDVPRHPDNVQPRLNQNFPTAIQHAISREQQDTARHRRRLEASLIQRMSTANGELRAEFQRQADDTAASVRRIEEMIREIAGNARSPSRNSRGGDQEGDNDRSRDPGTGSRRDPSTGRGRSQSGQYVSTFSRTPIPLPFHQNQPPINSQSRSASRERESAALNDFCRGQPFPRDASCRRTNGTIINGAYRRDAGDYTHPMRIEGGPVLVGASARPSLQRSSRDPNCESNESHYYSQERSPYREVSPPRRSYRGYRTPDQSYESDPRVEAARYHHDTDDRTHYPNRHSRSPFREHSPHRDRLPRTKAPVLGEKDNFRTWTYRFELWARGRHARHEWAKVALETMSSKQADRLFDRAREDFDEIAYLKWEDFKALGEEIFVCKSDEELGWQTFGENKQKQEEEPETYYDRMRELAEQRGLSTRSKRFLRVIANGVRNEHVRRQLGIKLAEGNLDKQSLVKFLRQYTDIELIVKSGEKRDKQVSYREEPSDSRAQPQRQDRYRSTERRNHDSSQRPAQSQTQRQEDPRSRERNSSASAPSSAPATVRAPTPLPVRSSSSNPSSRPTTPSGARRDQSTDRAATPETRQCYKCKESGTSQTTAPNRSPFENFL